MVCIIDSITLEKCVQTYHPKVCIRSARSALSCILYADLVCTAKKPAFTLVDEHGSVHTCRPCIPSAYVVGKRGVGCAINPAIFQRKLQIMAIDLDRIKREIPIETLIAQSFTVVGKGHTLTTAEHDSLKIFTRNNSWTWYSQAGRDGRNLGGSVIDWYKHMHQCSDGEAIRALSVILDGGAVPAMPKQCSVAAKVEPAAWKSPQWQADAWRRLETAQGALYDEDNAAGAAGRAYLTERGIRFDMWVAFGLGVGDAWNIKAGRLMPALWVPWANRQITAIQYRFLGVGKDDESADRFGQLKGGDRYLFGLQHCLEAAPGQLQTLFLVEGELNAISIFQVAFGHYPCDVVSFGPRANLRNADVAPVAAKVAQRYKRVIVWADEPDDALRSLGTVPHALPVRSPQIDGKEHDANDLLRAGLLSDVVHDLISLVVSQRAK